MHRIDLHGFNRTLCEVFYLRHHSSLHAEIEATIIRLTWKFCYALWKLDHTSRKSKTKKVHNNDLFEIYISNIRMVTFRTFKSSWEYLHSGRWDGGLFMSFGLIFLLLWDTPFQRLMKMADDIQTLGILLGLKTPATCSNDITNLGKSWNLWIL